MGASLQSIKGNLQAPAEQYKYLVVTRLRFREMVSVLSVVWRGEGGERGRRGGVGKEGMGEEGEGGGGGGNEEEGKKSWKAL